ncbi:MAG: glycosyltransferase family 2 protein [Synechococcaceae cyanobacterium]|nr:glycosyltransferase family 2 protein [Synechococcaceae cyanobacterium]
MAVNTVLVLLWARQVLLWWAGLRFLQRPSQLPLVTPPTAGVSVIVPAFNEAGGIGAALRALAAGSLLPIEVIVVDDGSRDGTAELAQAELASFAHGLLVRHAVNQGKAAALNTGLQHCSAELVLAIDADTRLQPEALAAAVCWLQAADVDAVAFRLEATHGRQGITQLQRQEYLCALNIDRAGQAALGAIAILPGAATLFRRSALERNPFFLRTCTEDADLSLSLSRRGLRFSLAPGAWATTFVPTSFAALLRQRSRWIRGHLQCLWWHGSLRAVAAGRFHLLTFPNFAVATLLPLMAAVIAATLWATRRSCLLGISWAEALAISLALVYAQRLSCWFVLPPAQRPARVALILEPLLSALIASLATLSAIVTLVTNAVQRRGHQESSWHPSR